MTPIGAPPMLRRSWQMLVQATAERPALIPPGSLNAQIADRLWGAGAWLSWQAPEVLESEEAEAMRAELAYGLDSLVREVAAGAARFAAGAGRHGIVPGRE